MHVNESRPLRFVRTPTLRTGNEIAKSEDDNFNNTDIEIIEKKSAVVKYQPDAEEQKQFARNLGRKESEGLSGQFVVQYDVERDPSGGEVSYKNLLWLKSSTNGTNKKYSFSLY